MPNKVIFQILYLVIYLFVIIFIYLKSNIKPTFSIGTVTIPIVKLYVCCTRPTDSIQLRQITIFMLFNFNLTQFCAIIILQKIKVN